MHADECVLPVALFLRRELGMAGIAGSIAGSEQHSVVATVEIHLHRIGQS